MIGQDKEIEDTASLKARAEAGDKVAMYDMAMTYDPDSSSSPDSNLYIQWLTKSAEAGFIHAKIVLSLELYRGEYVEASYDDGMEWARQVYNEGNGGGAHIIARAYLNGEGVEKNQEKYIDWLKKAAELQDGIALRSLAHEYRKGEKVDKNLGEYTRLLEEAIQNGNAASAMDLSREYFAGVQFEKDLEKAFEYANKAAELGSEQGKVVVAGFYRYGHVVDQNLDKATELVESAASAGNPRYLYLAAQFRHPDAGDRPNTEFYFRWIVAAAEAGYEDAYLDAAYVFHDGVGTDQDFGKFKYWLECAAGANTIDYLVMHCIVDLEDSGCAGELISEILSQSTRLHRTVKEIQADHIVKEAPQGVAHFTSRDAIENMLPIETSDQAANVIRLYNISYVNDPREGRALLDIERSDHSKLLRQFFEISPDVAHGQHTVEWGGWEFSVYAGSFTLNVDRLELWRSYGRDGKGYCLVTPLESFDQNPVESLTSLFHEAASSVGYDREGEKERREIVESEVREGESGRVKEGRIRPTLYEVRYGETAARRTLKRLAPQLREIRRLVRRLPKGWPREKMCQIVQIIMSDIIYLYKSNDYQTEREARIVMAFDIGSPYIRADNQVPNRLYVETEPFLFDGDSSDIIMGPKVANKEADGLNFKYRIARNGWRETVRVKASAVQYR